MLSSILVSAFTQQAAALAVSTLWQGSVIAAALAICLRLLPRTSAEQRFTLWAAAFATIVSLPFVKLLSGFFGAASSTFAPPAFPTSASSPMASPFVSIDARWSFAIAALWAVAALYRATDLALHSIRIRRIWKQAIPVQLDGNLKALLAATPAAIKRWPFEVCTTAALQRPCVIGFFKPRILIPDWLFTRLTADELEQIVLHEAEHLRRRDDWTNLGQKLCLVLFPLNPALVWIEHRLCREREMACDDGVISITRAPRAYAACLASLAERGLERHAEALSLGVWRRRPELVHRVHSILRRTHAMSPIGSRVLLSALGCGLVAGSVALARCPQLVAFVSAPVADVATSTSASNRHTASARMINATYVEHRTAIPLRSDFAAHSVSRTAEPSTNAVIRREQQRAAEERSPIQQNVSLVGEGRSYNHSASTPKAVMLKAEMPNAIFPPAQQQWFVVATWEQVEAPSRNAGLTADYAVASATSAPNDSKTAGAVSASSVSSFPDGSVQPPTQPARQITVTRLIFKIYPATSVSTQPTTLPIRGGWFVLQL